MVLLSLAAPPAARASFSKGTGGRRKLDGGDGMVQWMGVEGRAITGGARIQFLLALLLALLSNRFGVRERSLEIFAEVQCKGCLPVALATTAMSSADTVTLTTRWGNAVQSVVLSMSDAAKPAGFERFRRKVLASHTGAPSNAELFFLLPSATSSVGVVETRLEDAADLPTLRCGSGVCVRHVFRAALPADRAALTRTRPPPPAPATRSSCASRRGARACPLRARPRRLRWGRTRTRRARSPPPRPRGW